MRTQIIKVIFFVSMFLIVLRLGYWQVIRADDLTAMAEDQRLLTQEIKAPRGKILFADNSVLAATQPTFLVYVQPKLMEQKHGQSASSLRLYHEDVARKLTPIFWEEQLRLKPNLLTPEGSPSANFDPEKLKKEKIDAIEKDLLEKMSKDLHWVSVGKKVDMETKNKIEKLEIHGLGFEQSTTRFYPEGSSSAHLLGFVGSDAYGEDTGYFGIEGFYNGELKGKKGVITQEKDAMGLPILIGKFTAREPKEGKTLVLHIDRTIQHMAEEKLKKGIEKYQAKGGAVVVMDPKTGGILAMASYPNYDPTHAFDFPSDYFRNPITADGYEPGSTFKVLVMAAGINEGVITPQTVCDICAGPLSLGGFTIRTWNNKYTPNGTMTDVLIHSDNTGMVYVARKLGTEKLISYIQQFGFGQSTGIDLQDERSPDLRDPSTWKEIDQATASFGQGISVTALQVVRAVAAIANGGYIMEPHVVSEVKDDKKTFVIKPRVISQPLKPEITKQVTEMMVAAVDDGESKFAKPKGYRVAGKTGTAQIPVAGHYDPNKTIASFVGFAPADNPKFVMLVIYNQPTSSIYGAETAAPTFFEVAKEIFTYYGIPPTDLSVDD